MTQLDYHTFVVTGAPKGTAIACNQNGNLNHYPVPIYPDAIGSLEVRLSCDCELLIPSRLPVRPPYPCPSNIVTYPTVHIIIPTIMSKVDVMLKSSRSGLDSNHVTFPNLTAVFNETWDMDTPRLNTTELSQLKKLIVPSLVHFVAPTTSTAFLLWNIILTVVVAFLLFKDYQNGHAGLFLGLASQQVPTAEGVDPESHHIFNMTVVFFLLILQLLACVIALIYVCYRRNADKKKFNVSQEEEGSLMNWIKGEPTPTVSNPTPSPKPSPRTPKFVMNLDDLPEETEMDITKGETKRIIMREGNQLKVTVLDVPNSMLKASPLAEGANSM